MRFLALVSILLAQAAPAPQFTSSLPPVPPPSEVVPQTSLLPAPQRMETDDSPSSHSCTFARAIRGDHCTFEGASGTADVRDNTAAVRRAGAEACAAEANKDDSLRGQCEHQVAEISLRMPCARTDRLADARGRLTAEAEGCVEELRAAVARVGRIVTLSKSCCTCLAESRCSVAESQCRNELADLSPGAGLRGCLSRSCDAACSVFAPSQPVKERDPEPPQHAALHLNDKT
jgi:hypothetical protein